MFVKEIEGRRHYVCNECKKPYSFKVGKTSAPEWSVTAVTAHPRPIPAAEEERESLRKNGGKRLRSVTGPLSLFSQK